MTSLDNCRILLLTAGIVLVSHCAFSQQKAYESPAGTKFLLYTPPGYHTSSSSFPLLLSLHSKGEVGNDLEELTVNNSEQMPSRLIYLNRWRQDLPFIVLTPQLKPVTNDPEIQWSAEYIDEVVSYVTKNFRVDPTRIYVTGISRGGTGAWTYTSAFPEKVAALVPISGRSDLAQACPLRDIPIWAFHGEDDGIAPSSYSIDMVNAIEACKPSGLFRPRLNILHARNHNGWNEIYNGSSGYRIYDWLLMFRKGDTANKKPYVNAGPGLRMKSGNEPLYLFADFFDWDGAIASVSWKQTAGTPLILDDPASEFLKIRGQKTGVFEFQVTATDDKGATGVDKVTLEITDASAKPIVLQMVLFDGKTDKEIGNLSESMIVNKSDLDLSEINIKAIASDGTASVRFGINSNHNVRTQNNGPYFMKNPGTNAEWKVVSGTYFICATPYAQSEARGDHGVSQCYKVTFTDGITPDTTSQGQDSNPKISTPPSPTDSIAQRRRPEKHLYIFPNPVVAGGSTQIAIYEPGALFDPGEKTLEIIGMRGELIHLQRLPRSIGDEFTIVDLQKELISGVYMINVVSNGRRSSTRLFVR